MLSFSHSFLCLSGALQDTGGVGGLLAVVRDDGGFAPTYDANGNVSEYIQLSAVQTDNYPSLPIAGGIVAHYEYDAFGEITAQSGGMADGFMFRFSTKHYENETGILHYEFRPSRPSLGCWLSRDPIGERGGENLYGFTRNNPINRRDYLGMEPEPPGWFPLFNIAHSESEQNCLGHAIGFGAAVKPAEGKSLESVLTQFGYTCTKTGDPCECGKCEEAMVVYIYTYNDNPENKDPWRDPWISSEKNDYHAIRRDIVKEPRTWLGGLPWFPRTITQWNEVPFLISNHVWGHCPKDERTNGIPTPDSTNPDSHWTEQELPIPSERYCCCKPKDPKK